MLSKICFEEDFADDFQIFEKFPTTFQKFFRKPDPKFSPGNDSLSSDIPIRANANSSVLVMRFQIRLALGIALSLMETSFSY